MPPNSHSLVEEGAAILSFKLVKAGVFQARASACQLPLCSGMGSPGSHTSDQP